MTPSIAITVNGFLIYCKIKTKIWWDHHFTKSKLFWLLACSIKMWPIGFLFSFFIIIQWIWGSFIFSTIVGSMITEIINNLGFLSVNLQHLSQSAITGNRWSKWLSQSPPAQVSSLRSRSNQQATTPVGLLRWSHRWSRFSWGRALVKKPSIRTN